MISTSRQSFDVAVTHSSVHPHCLLDVGHNKIVEAALGTGCNRGRCQGRLRMKTLDSTKVVEPLALGKGRPKNDQSRF